MYSVGIGIKLPKLGTLDAQEQMNALRKASPQIALAVERRIRERALGSFTQGYSRGAIGEDITGKPFKSDVSGKRTVNLVTWYVADENQLFEWGRVYAPYQEGPPIGLSTYTTGMHQFLAKVETEDAELIQAWADETIRAWAEQATAEANAQAETIGETE